MDFKDTKGRVWSVPKLTLWHVKTLNEVTNIELEDVITGGILWDASDECWLKVGAMAWHWCQDQHEVTEEEFFRAWDGEVFEKAQEALLDAIANFTPTKRREAILAMANVIRKVQEALPQMTEEKIRRVGSILSENATSELEKLASQTPPVTASVK